MGDSGVVTWHDYTWRGRGLFAFSSPTPRLGCARTRASFGLSGRAVLVACNSWTSLGVWGPGLPPIHRLGCARALPFANTIFNSQIIISNYLNVKSRFQMAVCSESFTVTESSNCNLSQTLIFEIYLNLKFISTISLIGIMFAYTTSDVYLTIRLTF